MNDISCYKRLCAESLLQAQGYIQEANRCGRLSRKKTISVKRQVETCLNILSRDCEARVLLMAEYLRMGEFLDRIDHKEEANGKASVCRDSVNGKFGG